MKKKILSNILLVVMVATLSACGSTKEDTISPTNETVISTEAPIETSVPTDKPVEDVKDNVASTEVPNIKETTTPTKEPIAEQTNAPTEEPTISPTAEPTVIPTEAPTKEPVATETPTIIPTAEPTMVPTEAPTKEPVVEATAVPTEQPVVTTAPTEQPVVTAEPTAQPTVAPTEPPQITPTPTEKPICRHNWTIETTLPTCTTKGIQKEYCSMCGENTTFEIPLIDHNMVNGICSSCGQTDATVHVHNWILTNTIQEATCACVGIGNYLCTDCLTSKTEDIPKTTNHNYVKLTDGCSYILSEYGCTICGTKYTSMDSSCSDGNGDDLCDKCNK